MDQNKNEQLVDPMLEEYKAWLEESEPVKGGFWVKTIHTKEAGWVTPSETVLNLFPSVGEFILSLHADDATPGVDEDKAYSHISMVLSKDDVQKLREYLNQQA